MKKKQTIFRLVTSIFIVFSMVGISLLINPDVNAACGGVDTSIINCSPSGSGIQGTGVWAVLLIGVNILTALVGVAAVAGVVYGAILYTTAEGDQGKVEKAIEVFRNVGIGVVAYALMYIGLNFIIPGGVFA